MVRLFAFMGMYEITLQLINFVMDSPLGGAVHAFLVIGIAFSAYTIITGSDEGIGGDD